MPPTLTPVAPSVPLSEPSVRPRLARPGDALELARLRRLMFEAMGRPVANPEAWDRACARRITELLTLPQRDRRLIAVVIDDDRAAEQLAASAMAEIVDRLPDPTDGTARWAYLSSVSTDPGHRRRGFARSVMRALVAEVRAAGATRIELHATPDGEGLYRELGFARFERHPEMRFVG